MIMNILREKEQIYIKCNSYYSDVTSSSFYCLNQGRLIQPTHTYTH